MTSADMRRAFLGLLLLLAVPAAAQVTTSKPIEVEAPKPKKLQFKGEVLTVSRVAITVRSLENANLVRTFTFSEKLAPKMAKQIDADRSYQHGDRVKVVYLDGTEVALKIKGKPRQQRP